MKRVIQAYKAPHQWVGDPPGLGDFVRGSCHLFEMLPHFDMELRLDVSQTEFAGLIEQDDAIFQAGDESRIAAAEELDEEDGSTLRNRLAQLRNSDNTELYVCTNVGAWNRLTLPDNTRRFMRRFYHSSPEVEGLTARALPAAGYAVLSVRCGDRFYDDPAGTVPDDVGQLVDSIVERHILPGTHLPVVVTSDCHALKIALARRYGMAMLPHRSRHGAFGDVLPVAIDLCMLKHSRLNCHINLDADWWSGFSHYTSMIFNIPSMNFREPRYAKEEITAQGRLQPARRWWQWS